MSLIFHCRIEEIDDRERQINDEDRDKARGIQKNEK